MYLSDEDPNGSEVGFGDGHVVDRTPLQPGGRRTPLPHTRDLPNDVDRIRDRKVQQESGRELGIRELIRYENEGGSKSIP